MIEGPKPLVLPADGMDHLIKEANESGHRFVARFVHKWDNDLIRFDGVGEQIIGIWSDGLLVAFAALHRDQYLNDPKIGRLRHLYVANSFRKQGFGRCLVAHLLNNAQHFDLIRLRAGTESAANFYDHIGWKWVKEDTATHHWVFVM